MASQGEEEQPPVPVTEKQKEVAEEKKPVEPIRLPTPEEMRGQDIWNNCFVRSAVSGFMGKSQVLSYCFIYIWKKIGISSANAGGL